MFLIRPGGLDIFDSHFNGINMLRASRYMMVTGNEIQAFMVRVRKYILRISYSHFAQFSYRLDNMSLEEYITIKMSFSEPCTNLFIMT